MPNHYHEHLLFLKVDSAQDSSDLAPFYFEDFRQSEKLSEIEPPLGSSYRVYHIEMDETKWLREVEVSIILLNYGV